MKLQIKKMILAGLLTLSSSAWAQTTEAGAIEPVVIDGESFANKYFSRLIPAAWTLNIFSLNSKFQNYDYANVLFTAEKVKINIFKKMPDCKNGMMCPQVMPAPELIVLPVVKVEKRQCWDVYYAKTPDNVKSTTYEQIVLQRFASERCQNIGNSTDGHLHYRISGANSAGAAVQADAHFVLADVKIVEEE